MNHALEERLYRSMRRIRRFEEVTAEIYPSDRIKSPIHLAIGQEQLAVAVCDLLEPGDWVAGSYRSHAMYLAKGGAMPALMAEMYGKATGCSAGKGGSMHVIATARGVIGTSAVVGSQIPVAAGYALAAKRAGRGGVVAVFLGDGATEEGCFYETLNFAALHRLPLLLVVENNGLAIHEPLAKRRADPDGICKVAEVARRPGGADCRRRHPRHPRGRRVGAGRPARRKRAAAARGARPPAAPACRSRRGLRCGLSLPCRCRALDRGRSAALAGRPAGCRAPPAHRRGDRGGDRSGGALRRGQPAARAGPAVRRRLCLSRAACATSRPCARPWTRRWRRDASVFLFGLDVDDHLGIQGSTRGLLEKFGPDRVFTTPLSEDAMTGPADRRRDGRHAADPRAHPHGLPACCA